MDAHLAVDLKLAIDTNDVERVKILMTANPALHRAPLGYGKDGPLTWVAECRVPWEPPGPARLAIAKWMIESGSDVHQGGDGPLMRAALNGDRIPMMELLVAHGADVNASWHGSFPIVFAACEALDPDALRWLLEHGADPNPPSGSALDYLIGTYARSPQDERSRERDDQVVEEGIAKLIRTGVTSVHHNNGWPEFLILKRLHEAGKLRLRVYSSPSFPGWERLRDYIAEYGRGDAWLHWGAIKAYGVITAEVYYPWVSGASQAGLQVMVHTGANDELRTLLSVFERVRREQHLRDPRFRVEHAHDMPPDSVPRMVEAGAIASWQPPLLAHEDLRTAAGQPAPKNLFPCHSLLSAGVKIAFGTDTSPWISGIVAPVESLRMALERAAPDGTRITLDEALRAFTLDAAYAEFAEKDKGSLEPGKLADFVLFDRDFSSAPARAISDAKVRMTVIGGHVAWE